MDIYILHSITVIITRPSVVGDCGTERLLLSSSLGQVERLYLVEPDHEMFSKGPANLRAAFGDIYQVIETVIVLRK